MTSRKVLSGEALDAAVAALDGWSVEEGKLHKKYVFADFIEAFSFMTAAALSAERKNHHPEWSNVYHTVVVDLSTHDAGGITMWDVELAQELDQAAR